MEVIEFSPTEGSYPEYLASDRVVRLSKSQDGEKTFIHLDTGEILESEDSMKTIAARVQR